MDFLSDFTGGRKALIIGIAYKQDKKPMSPFTKGAKLMRKFLMEHYNFRKQDITFLMDKTEEDLEESLVCRANIVHEMEMLVKDAKPNDSLFFYYSGHGYSKDKPFGDEWDNLDECICPADYRTAGYITDDEIYHALVRDLPQKCRLTAVFDTCRSGTMLDLPYEYNELGKLVIPNPRQTQNEYLGDWLNALSIKPTNYDPQINLDKRNPPKDVIAFSSCRDTEVGKGKSMEGIGRISLFLHSFLEAALPSKNPTFLSIIKDAASFIGELGYPQKPQFSSGYPVDVETPFMC